MAAQSPLYLGFDLSTQQLKGVAVTSDLKVEHSAVFDFDKDAPDFGIKKGVLTNEKEHEVFAPLALWLRAIDVTLARLRDNGADINRVRGISGAGMQHGSVYWSENGVQRLQSLNPKETLEEQLKDAFAYPFSPNWQDASTQEQCDAFDQELGDVESLARITGSKAHHRFTGPQILRFAQRRPSEFKNTARISLVSSFLASMFLGSIAPMDISDVCGMNLWDIQKADYDETLLRLAAGSSSPEQLKTKLGSVPKETANSLGNVSNYYVQRYGFDPSCKIIPFTGDNPSTILALPLRPLDAIVSLGTSTTFLMSTPYFKPDPAVHFMNHPAAPGLYMFMLCYKNGGLAREQVRDALAPPSPKATDAGDPWHHFNELALSHHPFNADNSSSPIKLSLYFPRPEIVPNVPAGTYRYTYSPSTRSLTPSDSSNGSSTSPWSLPEDDPRAILESQLLSLRLRSASIVAPPSPNPNNLPPQPRRIFLVGGGSHNPAIARLVGEILGGVEGVYKLDVGGNACALGSAYKAVWACERRPKKSSMHDQGITDGGMQDGGDGEGFEEFVGARWREEDFCEKVDDGFRRDRFERYAIGVEVLKSVEEDVLKKAKKDVKMAGATGAGAPADADRST